VLRKLLGDKPSLTVEDAVRQALKSL
jgi:hypothetical protein